MKRENRDGGVWKDWLPRAVMNVTPRHAPVRLKFVIFGTHDRSWNEGKVNESEEGRINRLQGVFARSFICLLDG